MSIIAKTIDPPCAIVGYENAPGGAMIELMPIRDEGLPPEQVGRFAPGLRHLAFRVDDFDAAYNALKAAGVTFIGEAVNALGGGKLISFRDPEGNELQIVERPHGDQNR